MGRPSANTFHVSGFPPPVTAGAGRPPPAPPPPPPRHPPPPHPPPPPPPPHPPPPPRPAPVTVQGGVATFGNLSVNQAGTGYTLVASAPGLADPTSAAFNVTTAVASSTIEDFEHVANHPYTATGPTAGQVMTWAAHDGTYGLMESGMNSFGWIYRTDAAAQVRQGETISLWVQLSTTANGEAFFGFGASAGRTPSNV